jgi:hypothetical protein
LAVNRGQEADMIGKTISHYKILEKLGEGGMSQNCPRVLHLVGRVVAVLRIPLKRSESLRSRCLKRGNLSLPNLREIRRGWDGCGLQS